MRLWTHKRRPITHPKGWAMVRLKCCMWMKLTCVIRVPHCMSNSEIFDVLIYIDCRWCLVINSSFILQVLINYVKLLSFCHLANRKLHSWIKPCVTLFALLWFWIIMFIVSPESVVSCFACLAVQRRLNGIVMYTCSGPWTVLTENFPSYRKLFLY